MQSSKCGKRFYLFSGLAFPIDQDKGQKFTAMRLLSTSLFLMIGCNTNTLVDLFLTPYSLFLIP